ncbi:MAG: hypothetical protein NC040_01410 [Muribaculaceae bacterium]|nr:hypothetical protein [Alistipes senegalensis]MCM1472686.1 hypothetical protein [Muribaculaceae bacterium]
MEKHRQIAFISAFILALVIMMAGKACTDSTMKKHSQPVQKGTQQSIPANNNNSYNNYNNGYNNTPQQTTIPEQTSPPVNYITNMLGEIVGTEVIETIPEIQTTTQELSILEQYNAGKQQNNNDIPAKNNNNYQTPSEIHITIR